MTAMSTPLIEDLLFSAGQLNDDQPGWLEDIVRNTLKQSRENIPEWRDNGCRLSDMGQFLVRATLILAHTANLIAHGDHIDIYTRSKIQEMSASDDFSNLQPLRFLSKKDSSLKSVGARTCFLSHSTDI